MDFGYEANKETKNKADLTYGNIGIELHRGEDTPGQRIEIILFTKMGAELSKLIQQTTNINYMDDICLSFKHPKVKIEFGDLVITADGQRKMLNKVVYEK